MLNGTMHLLLELVQCLFLFSFIVSNSIVYVELHIEGNRLSESKESCILHLVCLLYYILLPSRGILDF